MTGSDRACSKDDVPIRVFVFEDHWMCREALLSVLGKEEDIEIVGAAEEVGEGMDRAVRARPDVVLMDVLFHGERLGIEATAALKGRLPEARVVVFTEFPDEETLRGAVAAGASGFLLKREVQEPEVIADAIRAVGRGEAYLTPSMTVKILAMVQRLATPDRHGLTKRELEVLQLVAEGKDNKRIGRELGIDERTVANHVSNLLFKLNARNRTEASAIARREGWLR
jgi:DNA-binding NarL/FixJ family response regulator